MGRCSEVALTTNGSQLKKFSAGFAAAGVRRINVSLDTLDAREIQGHHPVGDFAQVMDGIRAASPPAFTSKSTWSRSKISMSTK